MKKRAQLEPLRTLAFGGISGTYAAVGTAFVNPSRLICFTNNTDGDLIFSRDPLLIAGEIFIAAGGFKLFDISTNRRPSNQDDLVFEIGTQWYVKQVTAPTEGDVYIETIFAE